jgi:hypothetical protein
VLTWIKNGTGLRKARVEEAGRDRLSIEAVSDKKLLWLPNGFKIIDDRTHVLRGEDELRHVRMTGRKALRQGLGKAFDLVFARERSEGRSRRARASPGGADGMAARAIPRQQQLATSCGRGGLLCQDGRHHAHCDHRDETIEDLPAHG